MVVIWDDYPLVASLVGIQEILVCIVFGLGWSHELFHWGANIISRVWVFNYFFGDVARYNLDDCWFLDIENLKSLEGSMRSNINIVSFALMGFLVISLPVRACVVPDFLNQDFLIKGVAENFEGKVLYEEILKQEPGFLGGKLSVKYSTPEGITFATKVVEYNCNPTTPSFTLLDSITGKVEGVNWNFENIESFQDERSTIIDHPDSQFIIDAGFDNAIKLNWKKLLEGQSVIFDYLFARKNQFLKLRFEKTKVPRAINGESISTDIFFKVVPNNVIFRAISSPIFVGYNRYSQSLRYYIGPTNLPMLVGGEKVIIRYQNLASL
ncbi:MAG: hypothetical protein ACI9FD_004194 [Gammaproteobacteria bacterium]